MRNHSFGPVSLTTNSLPLPTLKAINDVTRFFYLLRIWSAVFGLLGATGGTLVVSSAVARPESAV